MANASPPQGKSGFTIRLVGLQPGTSQDEMVKSLGRIYRRRSEEEIRRALARLPIVLARSATQDQAQKIRRFLEPKGAILEIGYEPPVSPAGSPRPSAAIPETVQQPPPEAGPLPSGMVGPPVGVERRAKPRVHAGIQLYPMGIGEILDRSFHLFRDHFWLFFVILLIPQGAAFLVGKVAQLAFWGGAVEDMTLTMGVGMGISTVLGFVVFFLLQIWAQGALIHAVSETYLGHRTSVGEAYGAMRSRLGRLFGTLFLMWLLVGLGFLLFVIPGIILLVNWLMVDKVVVLEGGGGSRALSRSKELMKARTEPGFWKGPKNKAGLILISGIVIGVGIRFLFQIPGLALQFLLPGSMLIMTVNELLKMAAESLATTYTAIAMIIYYYDIRIRREGFDLRMMAQGL